MSDTDSFVEMEFFVTGAMTYLDVDDAMAQFRRRVQDQCTVLVSRRLVDINHASNMSWTRDDLKDYKWREGDYFHVGTQLTVENLGGLYFCLELYREHQSSVCGALVYLYRKRANLASLLWGQLPEGASDTAYRDGNNLFFERLLTKDELPNFPDHLNQQIDHFIAFMEGCGGLTKYLPPSPV
jgi:hypothetical protein